jgi:hypothetical protein
MPDAAHSSLTQTQSRCPETHQWCCDTHHPIVIGPDNRPPSRSDPSIMRSPPNPVDIPGAHATKDTSVSQISPGGTAKDIGHQQPINTTSAVLISPNGAVRSDCCPIAMRLRDGKAWDYISEMGMVHASHSLTIAGNCVLYIHTMVLLVLMLIGT